jgi:nitrogen fixation protein FixH
MRDLAVPGRELTGFKVMMWLLAFFGAVGAINVVLVHYALSTFGGVEVANGYATGLRYQDRIDAAAEQKARGWQVTTDLVRIGGGGAEFQLRPVDARGHALTALEVGATLRHPADRRLDQALIFVETAPGLYVATQTAPSGLWDLALELRRGGQVAFRSVNRMVLR